MGNRIRLVESGFVVESPEHTLVRWQEIRRIDAFKADLLTFDEVYLRFTVAHADRLVLVSEESVGFDDLVRAIRSRFPDSPGDWRERVVLPAFEARLIVLYDAAAADR